MKREILVVEDTFDLKGRGLVITGLVEDDAPKLRKGDRIEILQPNGSKINSIVVGVEMIGRKCFPVPNQKENLAFMVKDLLKEDVPRGSVINLVNE